MKKVLILYTAVGMGHKVVAENIGRALAENYPEVEVKQVDFLKYLDSPFLKLSEDIYVWGIHNLPWLWRFLYNNKFFNKYFTYFRLPAAAGKAKVLKKLIDKEKPDLVLTTQTTATAAVSYLKEHGLYRGKLVTTFSDFHFQSFWFYEQVDHYLLNTKAQAGELLSRGLPAERAHLVGLPVDKEFTKQRATAEIYKRFNISRVKPLILIGGASRGWGISRKDIEILLLTKFDIQIGVITGTDEDLRRELVELADKSDIPMRVFGWLESSEVADLFSVAKILIAKPGGLTTAQALISRLPTIFHHPLPGGEELNLEFLQARGVALTADHPRDVKDWMERLLQDSDLYKKIQQRQTRLAEPRAAEKAAKVIIDVL